MECGKVQLEGEISPRFTVLTVDRNLRTPYQDEFTFKFERELWAETSLSATYINRAFQDQIQDLNINLENGDLGRLRGETPTNHRTSRDRANARQSLPGCAANRRRRRDTPMSCAVPRTPTAASLNGSGDCPLSERGLRLFVVPHEPDGVLRPVDGHLPVTNEFTFGDGVRAGRSLLRAGLSGHRRGRR